MSDITYETLHHGMNPQQYLKHVLELATHNPCHYTYVYSAFQELSYTLHFASIRVIKSLFTILFRWLKPCGPASNEVMHMTYHMAPIFDIVVPQLNNKEIRMAFAKFLAVVHAHIDMDTISQNWLHDEDALAYFQEINDVIGTSLDKIGHSYDINTHSPCLQVWEGCIDDLVRLLA